MSSSEFDPSDLEHLDRRTHDIVLGYIKQLASSLRDEVHIENEINVMVLHYVHDHFMNYRGGNEWILTNSDIMHQIRSSQPGQLFTSDTFDICKLKWMIHLYPNGDSQPNANLFQLYLHLLSMPPKWRTLMVRISITCKELNLFCISTHSFGASIPSFASCPPSLPEDIFSFNELTNINPKQLTFNVSIKILQIMGSRTPIKHKDPFNSYRVMPLMNKYRNKLLCYKKQFELKWAMNPSEIASNSNHWLQNKKLYSRVIGDLFHFCFIPNEKTLILEVNGLPHNEISGLNVKWSIQIPEMNVSHSITSKLMLSSMTRRFMGRAGGRGGFGAGRNRYRNSGSCSHLLIPSLNFDEWKKYHQFTFVIDVKIMNEFDEAGNIINNESENEWTEILDADKQNNKNNEGKDAKGNKSKGAEEVRKWMKEVVGLEKYSDLLIKNGYDNMRAVGAIKNSDLQRLGIELLGHRKQIVLFAEQKKADMGLLGGFGEIGYKEKKKKNEKEKEVDIDENNEVIVWLRDEMKMPELCKTFSMEKIDDFETVKSLDADALNDWSRSWCLGYGEKFRLLKEIQKMKDNDWKKRYVAVGCGLCVFVGCAYYYSTKQSKRRD